MHGLQCGFSRPGIHHARLSLSRKTPNPSKRKSLRTFRKPLRSPATNIVKAIQYPQGNWAAASLRRRPNECEFADVAGAGGKAQGLGCRRKRVEDIRFVQGKGNYVDDLKLPGTLYGDLVRSPHAHARIKSIDVSPAMKVPGVLAVLTAADLINGRPRRPCRRTGCRRCR